MRSEDNFHEPFRKAEAPRGSERSFGLVIAGAFGIFAFLPLLRGAAPRWTLLLFAVGFMLAALAAPKLLAPLNRIWYRFGLLLQMFVAPVVMGVIFVIGVLPTALILRLAGKDPMRRRADPKASTYWIAREPPGPPPATMTNQF